MTASARIVAVDYALPDRVVTNDDLALGHPSWDMGSVQGRTGVLARHIARPGETALDLSLVASERLLSRVDVARADVDGLIVCTQTPDYPMPPNACLLQDRLKLERRTAAYDFTLACSGYVYGLFMANAFIRSGALRNVLLVTGDTYSRLIGPDDRGPASLFGDGAAATLLSGGEAGILEFDLGTDGAGSGCFIVPGGGMRLPRSNETALPRTDRHGGRRSLEQIHMDGAAVLAFVQREVPASVRRVLARSGIAPGEIDIVVAHQASRVANDHLERALGLPNARFISNIERVGNTVSASIPIALRDAELQGALSPGMLVLFVSFGVGLSWGSCVVRW